MHLEGAAEWGSTVLTNEVSVRGEVKGRTKREQCKIELVEVKMERKGEKWRESSTVILIDSLLPISWD